MSKGIRNKLARKNKTNRKHTVVSKIAKPHRMNNPANAEKFMNLAIYPTR